MQNGSQSCDGAVGLVVGFIPYVECPPTVNLRLLEGIPDYILSCVLHMLQIRQVQHRVLSFIEVELVRCKVADEVGVFGDFGFSYLVIDGCCAHE